jgi:hypothetical protein
LGGGLQGLHGPYAVRASRIAGAFCVFRAACTKIPVIKPLRKFVDETRIAPPLTYLELELAA